MDDGNGNEWMEWVVESMQAQFYAGYGFWKALGRNGKTQNELGLKMIQIEF